MLPQLNELQWLQGGPEQQYELQLGVLIQANCPGCHAHAIPVANQLFESPRDYGMYMVSTAFEDFEWNTVESTNLLLREGRLVGVPRRYLGDMAPSVPLMAVAYDLVQDRETADPELIELALNTTKQQALRLAAGWGPALLRSQLERLGSEILPVKLARLFYEVAAGGTPTWYLHSAAILHGTHLGKLTLPQLQEWIAATRPPPLKQN